MRCASNISHAASALKQVRNIIPLNFWSNDAVLINVLLNERSEDCYDPGIRRDAESCGWSQYSLEESEENYQKNSAMFQAEYYDYDYDDDTMNIMILLTVIIG